MKAIRMTILLVVLAATLATAACGNANLYTGVSSNGGWNAPATRSAGGISGFPF